MSEILEQLRKLAWKYNWLYREDHWTISKEDGFFACEVSMRHIPNTDVILSLQWIDSEARVYGSYLEGCRITLRDRLVAELTKAGEDLSWLKETPEGGAKYDEIIGPREQQIIDGEPAGAKEE